MRNRNGLEARVNAKPPEDAPDVIPYRLGTEVQLGRDLLRRVAAIEKPQDFTLTRRQVWMRWRGSIVLLDLFHLSEDADDVVIMGKWDAAHLHREPLPVRPQEDASVVRTFWWPEEVAGEDLPATAPLLRRQDGGHLASDGVAHEPLGGRIEPTDDPVSVDHVGGDADAVERAFNIATELLQPGHAKSLRFRRCSRQPTGIEHWRCLTQRDPYRGADPSGHG